MVGVRLEYIVFNDDNTWDPNNSGPQYLHPDALVLYEAESDALDSSWNGTSHPFTDLAMYVEYDVYPNYTYRPAFSSRRAFKDFQLTRNVNDVVHMYVFCQSANVWTYDIHVL